MPTGPARRRAGRACRGRTVSQSALVVAAEDDPSVPLRNGRDVAARLPNARQHVAKGGGHRFLLDEPESVAGVIREFVDAP